MIVINKLFNRDLLYTSLNQIWRFVSGPATLIMIPLYLSSEVQGFWYMFMSLGALAAFADLGFSTIILQFSAHEFAYLRFLDDGHIDGEKKNLERLSSFFYFVLKRLSIVVLVVFPIILLSGFYILSSNKSEVDWHVPWTLYSICSAIVFMNSSILCFFEGCNSVSLVQNVRFKIAVAASITTIIGLFFDLQLYTLVASLFVTLCLGIFFIFNKFIVPINQMLKISKKYSYSWKSELMPLLWRYAVSWSSGYFLLQIYTPIVFSHYGAIEAGKVGISLAACSAIFSMSNIWIVAVTPKINMMIARRKWKELDDVFFKSFVVSTSSFILGMLMTFLLYFMFNENISIFKRFISGISMAFLLCGWLCQLIINTFAVYLRAHKEEPLMWISFISSIYVFISTYFCAKYLEFDFVFLGYLSSYTFFLPKVLLIFKKKRKMHMLDSAKSHTGK